MALFSFLFFLVGITGVIGFMAARKSKRSEGDYFLASQDVSPYVLALSGSASKFSGFMFAGFMGAAYAGGTTVIWLALGLIIGALISYWLTIFRLQAMNHGGWALSLGELITFQDGENRIWLRRFIGLLILFFLSVYAAAQLKAGGKALEIALGQPVYVGIVLSAVIILFYCWAGGIRASIWTDTAQVIIMTFSMVMLLVVATLREGGVVAMYEAFMASAPVGSDQTSLFPQNLSIGGYGGLALFFLGMLGFGLSSFGQPHVLVRAMALAERKDTKKFFATTIVFDLYYLEQLVGLARRVIPRTQGLIELALFSRKRTRDCVGLVRRGIFHTYLSRHNISCRLLSRFVRTDEGHYVAKAGTVNYFDRDGNCIVGDKIFRLSSLPSNSGAPSHAAATSFNAVLPNGWNNFALEQRHGRHLG